MEYIRRRYYGECENTRDKFEEISDFLTRQGFSCIDMINIRYTDLLYSPKKGLIILQWGSPPRVSSASKEIDAHTLIRKDSLEIISDLLEKFPFLKPEDEGGVKNID